MPINQTNCNVVPNPDGQPIGNRLPLEAYLKPKVAGAHTATVEEPVIEKQAAHLLIMAAATLLGPENPATADLLYAARALSHPLLVLKPSEEPK